MAEPEEAETFSEFIWRLLPEIAVAAVLIGIVWALLYFGGRS